jgi:hypothetical protein
LIGSLDENWFPLPLVESAIPKQVLSLDVPPLEWFLEPFE